MSSEVHAKCTNSSDACTSRFLASLALIQYSIALTSWLVSASMFLICSASRSEKDLRILAKSFRVDGENGFSSRIERSAASACSQASSTWTR